MTDLTPLRRGFFHRWMTHLDDRPYTPKTLAERWRCSAGAVHRLIRDGDLTAIRLGKNRLLITVAEVDRFETEGGSKEG